MQGHLLRAAAAATLRRQRSCWFPSLKDQTVPSVRQAQTLLPLCSQYCMLRACTPKIQRMSLWQRNVQCLTAGSPAACIRASCCFNSSVTGAAGGTSSSNHRCSSSGGGENGSNASAALFPEFPFTRVTDNSSHWLPNLARAKARQGVSFSRIVAAAKGDCTSADVQTVEQRAIAAVRREGWSIPGVSVVLFSAQWSEASRALQQWLSARLSALFLSTNSEGKGDKAAVAEFAVLNSEDAPVLLRVFGVAALPHCLLMANGRVLCELPAGASHARQEAFIAAVSSAVSTASENGEQTPSPRACLLDRLESAVRRRNSMDLNEIETLLHKLKEDLLLSAENVELSKQQSAPPGGLVMRNFRKGSALQSPWGSHSNGRYQTSSPGYLLDSDERTSQLTALATIALFDVPEVNTPDLQALHELLSWAMQSKRRSGTNEQQKDAPPLHSGVRATLEKICGREEPQWAPDDCPVIRRLSLYNQCLLNKSLFTKARGAQPLQLPRIIPATKAGAGTPRTATIEATDASFPEECLKVELWRLAEWLARTRRCLAARLFLDKGEALGLELAMRAHVEWLEDSAKCNYMEINVAGCQKKTAEAATGAAATRDKPQTLGDKERNKKQGVHPFSVVFEPRAPSAGRTLLTCMYTALGPDDRRVQETIGRFDVAVNAHEFYPVKFPHTKARRGGKPRMMRGRSGRWFWLGPYWKPPWAPKRRSFTEEWHLTNAAA